MMKMRDKMVITDWALEDRPREKMLLKGIRSLSNAERSAILIGSGNRRETAVELSQRILNNMGNSLNRLGKVSVQDLTGQFEGIGEAKAISIIAALELGRRRKSEDVMTRRKITCSRDVYDLMYASMVDLPQEEFWIVLLNVANTVLDTIRISQGGTAATLVDVKLVLKPAILQQASSIMLCHNHPSNNTTPSQADYDLTAKIVSAASFLDIRVLDHLIICESGYYSFADEGRL